MKVLASLQYSGLFITVEGPEVVERFGADVAGGLIEGYVPDPDLPLRDSVLSRIHLYCAENLLPTPEGGQVTILGA